MLTVCLLLLLHRCCSFRIFTGRCRWRPRAGATPDLARSIGSEFDKTKNGQFVVRVSKSPDKVFLSLPPT